MTTLIDVEGFEHQVKSGNNFGSAPGGIWRYIGGSGSISFPSGRNGLCMQFAPSAAECRAAKGLADGVYGILVGTFHFKTTSTTVTMYQMLQNSWSGFWFGIDASGYVYCDSGGGGKQTGPDVNDGTWHRVDYRADMSKTVNPSQWTCDWQVDGTPQTQLVTTTGPSADHINIIVFGTGSAQTFTLQIDDAVLSATSSDYPIGDLDVYGLHPTGDGSYANCGTVIEDDAGDDIDGTPTAYDLVDDWATTTADTATYVRQSAADSTKYCIVTFGDTSETDILGVSGFMAAFASGTSASAHGITRITDSGDSTLTDIYDGDMSETSLHYRRALVAPPGGAWSQSGLNGLKAQLGRSFTTTTMPYWTAIMLQYAVGPAAPPSGAGQDPMGMMGFFGA